MPISINGTGTITGISAGGLPDDCITTAEIAGSAVTTAKILDANITSAKLAQPMTLSTAQASTSGTAINFTGIPSWVKRVTVMLKGVSSNGTSNWLFQLGTSGGFATSGYLSTGSYHGGTNQSAASNYTTGFGLQNGGTLQIFHGQITMSLMDTSTNSWVASGLFSDSSQLFNFFTGGSVVLSGVATQARLTTVNGTDTFDAGSVNIMYEG
jgi:hypothetical protein